jgi:hypothetical protein
VNGLKVVVPQKLNALDVLHEEGQAGGASRDDDICSCPLRRVHANDALAPFFLRFVAEGALAARGGSRTEPFGADSGRMQGAAKRRILEVFRRAATQQTAQNLPERRRGDFHHGLLESESRPHAS